MKKWIIILSAGLLAVGLAGYVVFSGPWLPYAFAHLGGLGIMGFLGWLAGTIALRKGRNFNQALMLGFALPTLLGILIAAIVHLSGGTGCGGIVSLAASFIVIALYSLSKKRRVG